MMITRRHFTTLSAAAIGATLPPQPAAEETLRSELLLDLALEAQPPSTVGFPGGDRLIVGVSGGTFQGPRLRGTIVGPGGDWIVRRPDGSSVLDVRIVMLTDDLQKDLRHMAGDSVHRRRRYAHRADRADVRDGFIEVPVVERRRVRRRLSAAHGNSRIPRLQDPVNNDERLRRARSSHAATHAHSRH